MAVVDLLREELLGMETKLDVIRNEFRYQQALECPEVISGLQEATKEVEMEVRYSQYVVLCSIF